VTRLHGFAYLTDSISSQVTRARALYTVPTSQANANGTDEPVLSLHIIRLF